MARQLAINSSSGNYLLKSFLSATEAVGIVPGISYDDPIRKVLSFQSLTNLKNYSTSTQDGHWSDASLSPPLGDVMACRLQELSQSE
jgi:hypothetical protein